MAATSVFDDLLPARAPADFDALMPLAGEEEEKQRAAAGAAAIAAPGSSSPLALVPNGPVGGPIAQPDSAPEVTPSVPSSGIGALPPGAEGPQMAPEKPPMPGGDLTPEQLAAAATVPDNPNGDAVDKLLAANPVQPPPPKRAPVDLSTSAGVKAEEQRLYGEQADLTDQAVDAKKREGAAKQEIAKAEATQAAHDFEVAQWVQGKQTEIVDRFAAQRDRQAAYLDQQAQKYAQMEPHDYWADKSTGDKVLAGLQILFGGAGRTSNRDNPGLEFVNNAIERDFKLQQAKIEKQKANVAMAKDQYEMGLTSRQAALADLKLKEASTYDYYAKQAIAMKMRQGMSLEQAQNDLDVAKFQQEGLRAKKELAEALEANNERDYALATQRMMAEARARKLRGGGVGGAGSTSALQAMKDAANDENATEADVAIAGQQAGLPEKVAAQQAKSIYHSAMQMRQRVVRDANGNPLGVAPRGTDVAKLAEQQAMIGSYTEKINALADDIEKKGRIMNPYSDDGKQRLSLTRDIQSLGRKISGVNASNAGQQLEHEMIGGSGVGFERIASPKQLRTLADHAQKLVDARLKAQLQPLPHKVGDVAAEKAMEATEPTKGKPLPGGMELIWKKNKRTGAMKQFVRRPDGTDVPVDL